jgi:hypothetical protein
VSLADAIATFRTGTYTVTRRPAGTYTAGRHVAGSTSTVSCPACIQPASGRVLQRLPDGMRTSEVIAIWTEVELYVKSASYEPDLISYKSASYEVQDVKPWDDLAGFYHVLAIKV